jgi:hypothetical protein
MDFPTVTLAGRQWPVKPLVLKQLRIVEPAWARIKTAKGAVTETLMDDLIEISYQAIAPGADPKITRSEFTDLPVSLPEMIAALQTIAAQAGMIVKDAPAGEVDAGNPSTGTES